MTEFWESSFIENQTMWGYGTSYSAILATDFFLETDVKDILIPGFGYGRNTKVFIHEILKLSKKKFTSKLYYY